MKVILHGKCWDGECDCYLYAGMDTTEIGEPPFHVQCDCLMGLPEHTESTQTSYGAKMRKQIYIAELVTEFITKGFVSSEWIEKLNKFSEIYTFDMWEKEYREGKGDYGLQDNQHSKQLEESK